MKRNETKRNQIKNVYYRGEVGLYKSSFLPNLVKIYKIQYSWVVVKYSMLLNDILSIFLAKTDSFYIRENVGNIWHSSNVGVQLFRVGARLIILDI